MKSLFPLLIRSSPFRVYRVCERLGFSALALTCLLGATLISGAPSAGAQQAGGAGQESWWGRYEARATATQNMQPHWITPLVLVTPRLEQEFRTDFVHNYNPSGRAMWTYDNGKGLEFIPEKHTELLINLPPFFDHSNGEPDGFGDISFMMKERLFSRNEQHGNGIVTFFLPGSIPTGKNGNGSCCAVVTPTLAMGKGYGRWDVETTAGGTLPVTNASGLGHIITWNSLLQYHASDTGAQHGLGRFLWPELETNDSFYLGGANDGRIASYLTPGLLIGRIPLGHNWGGTQGRLGLTIGAGEQIAVTHFNPYNHATVITARIPF